MPQPLTPELQGRLILDAMKSYNVRSGEVLMQQHVMQHGIKHGLSNDDLTAGVNYALEQGWITINSNKHYILTDKGYVEV